MFSGNTSYSCPTEMTSNKTSWEKVLLIPQVLEGHGSGCVRRRFSFAELLSWALHQQCRCKKFDTFCDKIIKGIDLSITVQKDSWAFFTAGQAPCGAGNLDVSSTSRACRWGWGCDGAPHSCRHLCGIAPPWQRQLTHGSGQRGQIPLLWESRKPQINYNSSKLQK